LPGDFRPGDFVLLCTAMRSVRGGGGIWDDVEGVSREGDRGRRSWMKGR
jgi:hypothetical protein